MKTAKSARAMILLLFVGCASRAVPAIDPSTDHAYPTVLTPPRALGGDFAMQQDVTMIHAEGQHTLRTVLQKQGDVLTLVVLAPHGGRAFVLTQRGDDVRFESFMPDDLPFPPRYILYDIHRAWFARVGSARRDGETIAEEREGDMLMVRRFQRIDGQPAGEIVVHYEGGMSENAPITSAPPEQVRLDNGWFGYTVIIHTRQWQAL